MLIQFTMEYSKDEIPFINTSIKRNENSIWADLDVYRLHPVNQAIAIEISYFVSKKDWYYCRK